MARFRLSYWWIPLISSKIWCGSGGLEPGAFVQVYTADLTQLFTWTCERCGDLTEVYHHLKTVYDFTKAFQIHVWFGVEDSLNLFCDSGVWGDRADCWCEKLLAGNNNMCLLLTGLLPICLNLFFLLLSNRLFYIDDVFMMNQGYVGFAKGMNAVIVVFRGTQENR
jgi:hypothetical protein